MSVRLSPADFEAAVTTAHHVSSPVDWRGDLERDEIVRIARGLIDCEDRTHKLLRATASLHTLMEVSLKIAGFEVGALVRPLPDDERVDAVAELQRTLDLVRQAHGELGDILSAQARWPKVKRPKD